ncbi:ABC transporter substrate-binding protein [Gudongella sp. SC589]|uniref:ABC transporter substrate-binding protein n=1 Tax=Gudongella sp. SC589 TaxID=3385990 RepID=UPI003904B03F
MKKMLAAIMAGVVAMVVLTGCTAPGEAKENERYRIGIVQPVDHPSLNRSRDSMVEELERLGMGDRVEITMQNANGDMSLLQSIMQNLIGERVDMIVAIATPAAQAALSSTSDIPIVFAAVSNPVEAGLVKDPSKPEGNVTGVSNSIPVEDIIELSKVLTPDVKTYGFLYNSSEINSAASIDNTKEYCDREGIPYREVSITSTADIQQAVSSLVGQVDALFTPNDNMVASAMATYSQVATEAGIPIYVGADSMVADGGLATVGIDYNLLGEQTGRMIARIIDGESIGENPVETVSEYANVINVGIADKLGVRIPEELQEDFVTVGK